MEIERLACPFCGSKNSEAISDRVLDGAPFYYIECQDCGCRGPECGNKADSIEKWNQRAKSLFEKEGE